MELKLGKNIKALRKQNGRTQENLADALGITCQAVSRWESGAAYPDMEFIPSIANYFGVSIDALFGYDNERMQKIEALVADIKEKDRLNNGEDVCIDECIRQAQAGLIEFPGNEALLLCLAELLYNAGYARYGEHHLTDADGYDIYDTERHKTYAEWKEAITIYEKLLRELDDGEMKQETILYLLQLYLNTEETEKAAAVIEKLPDIYGSRDLLALRTCDGKARAAACDAVLSELLCVCADLLIHTVTVNKQHLTAAESVRHIKNALTVLGCANTPTLQSYYITVGICLYLSVFLWRIGDHNGAFAALEDARNAAMARDCIAPADNAAFTKELPSYWPFWCVPDYGDVETELKADPRWADWCARCAADNN